MRRLHGHQGQQLHQVVLKHIPQHAGLVVVVGPLGHIQGFGHGNLHMVDVVAIPDGFKDGVGKAEHQQVLHRFLAQVMVNAENLIFLKDGMGDGIQFPGGSQIHAKGLFHYNPPPTGAIIRHSRRLQPGNGGLVQAGGNRQVVEAVGHFPVEVFQFLEVGFQFAQAFLRDDIGHQIGNMGGKVVPFGLIGLKAAGFQHFPVDELPIFGGGQVGPGHADNPQFPADAPFGIEVAQGRHQLAAGQIAAGPENNQAGNAAAVLQGGGDGVKIGEIGGGQNHYSALRTAWPPN